MVEVTAVHAQGASGGGPVFLVLGKGLLDDGPLKLLCRRFEAEVRREFRFDCLSVLRLDDAVFVR